MDFPMRMRATKKCRAIPKMHLTCGAKPHLVTCSFVADIAFLLTSVVFLGSFQIWRWLNEVREPEPRYLLLLHQSYSCGSFDFPPNLQTYWMLKKQRYLSPLQVSGGVPWCCPFVFQNRGLPVSPLNVRNNHVPVVLTHHKLALSFKVNYHKSSNHRRTRWEERGFCAVQNWRTSVAKY